MIRRPFPAVGMAWMAWACALVLTVPGFSNLWVLLALLVSVSVTWWLQPRPRPAVNRSWVTLALLLLAVWLLLGVVQQRPALGGQVLWVLPELDPDSGSTWGGPVRTGQLLFALESGLLAASLVAAGGLLAVAVSAEEWHDTVRLVVGRGASAVTPVLVLAQVRGEDAAERGSRRSHGIMPVADTAQGSTVTVERRAEVAAALDDAQPRSRFGWVRMPVALVLLVFVLVRSISPGAESGPTLAVSALAVLTVVGTVLWRGERPQWSLRILPPLAGAAALAAAITFGGITDAWLLTCALLVLPAASLALWEKS